MQAVNVKDICTLSVLIKDQMSSWHRLLCMVTPRDSVAIPQGYTYPLIILFKCIALQTIITYGSRRRMQQ